jgi:alkyl hydroperoxide reductase subunit AhpC
MRHDIDSALAVYSINDSSGGVAVDDELDLLAAEDQEFCPVCSTELVEFDSDPFALHCPVCDYRYR